ncbi:winged helix-turn-helix transcriptional regulator [Allosphingosinicella deserti]|uniref:Transcriptional regulator n=1 Tax=Allosphingosinicella deserti TaxID=2116704 RepID=A0A2P7QH57_9SPHN|nr:helix-turn-helix domain-containing protein [Sphingomonas deserti]PSJ37317.1 transcriptional regulator [Sphingomonas deserti]
MTSPRPFKVQPIDCSIAAALDVVGERWSLLIVRAAFNKLRHFEEFQAALGIARNILADRLSRLVDHGILERVPDPVDRRRVVYTLTDKGKGLSPLIITLMQWGDRWGAATGGSKVLVDKRSRLPMAPMTVRGDDGRELALEDLEWVERDNLETDQTEKRAQVGS